MKLSARNVLKGKIIAITHGAVDSEVILELAPGVEIVSIITKSSAESLGLKVGDSAYAIIKAPNVIIGVE
jgi:molybdopterin-binding protein